MQTRTTLDSNLTLDPWGLIRDGLVFEERRARQSSIEDWGICEQRLGWKWENPDEYRTSSSPVRGTGYHAGLALAYETYRTEGRWPKRDAMHDAVRAAIDEEVQKATAFLWQGLDQQTLDTEACDCVDRYFDGEHFWNPDVFDILAVEAEAAIPRTELPGLPELWTITLQIDLVLAEPVSGRHILVDHKTSKRKWAKDKHRPHKTLQPSWYRRWWPIAWAAANGGELPATTFYFDVIQLQGLKFERREAPVTEQSIAIAERQAVELAQALESGRTLTVSPRDPLCDDRWCDWFDECPAGAALRDVAVAL